MKKQSFIYGSVILASSAVITKLIGAVFRIPLAEMLGGTGMGYFSSAYGIFLPVYAVTATGLPAAAARLTAEDIAVRNGSSLERIRRTALLLFGLTGLAGMLMIMLAALPFCRYGINNMAALPSVLMIAPAVLFGCPAAVLRGYYEGRRNMYPTALSQAAEALVKMAAGLAGAYYILNMYDKHPQRFISMISRFGNVYDEASAGKAAVAYASAAACGAVSLSVFAGLVFLVIYDRAALRKWEHRHSGTASISVREIIKSLAATAVPAALCALVTNLTSVIDLATIMGSLSKAAERSSELYTRYGITAEELPNFYYGSFAGLAVTVFNLVPSVTNMFGRVMLPCAAAAYSSGDRRALAESTENVLKAVTLSAMPCGLGIGILAEPVLNMLFSRNGAETQAAARPLAVMGIGIVLLCVSSAMFPIFQAAERADIPIKLMALGAAVKAAGNILAVPVPQLNITGAALSTDISYLVICIPALLLIGRVTGADIGKYTVFAVKVFLCAGACALTADMVYHRVCAGMSAALSVMLSAFSGAVVYIISTYFFGIIDKSTLKMLISQKNVKNT